MSERNVQSMERSKDDQPREKPAYVPPVIRALDEDEVLKTFQVTSAGISWWVM
jgi:hypothetical protein